MGNRPLRRGFRRLRLEARALTTGGGVQCWGDNYYGQLGDGYDRDSGESDISISERAGHLYFGPTKKPR